MAYNKLPRNTPDILRAAGLKVREIPGWEDRGRPTGSLDPVGVLCHHDAMGPNVSQASRDRLLLIGRSDLPGPLCQFGLQRDGTVVLYAAGRANHAGTARASGSVGAGDGNALYWGVEAANSGVGEPWPAAQYDAYVRLCAALCRDITGNSAATVRAHRETSVTGKIDPAGIDMDRFRARVAELIEGEDDMKQEDFERIRGIVADEVDKALDDMRLEVGGRPKTSVRRALAELLARVPARGGSK